MKYKNQSFLPLKVYIDGYVKILENSDRKVLRQVLIMYMYIDTYKK